MAIKTFHIELKCLNVESNDQMMALVSAVQRSGQLLHGDATLILGDSPAPEIILYGEDIVEGRTDINARS